MSAGFAVCPARRWNRFASSSLRIYPGGDHGLASTHKDQLNGDLLAFIRG
jgi:hypothetical protein